MIGMFLGNNQVLENTDLLSVWLLLLLNFLNLSVSDS